MIKTVEITKMRKFEHVVGRELTETATIRTLDELVRLLPAGCDVADFDGLNKKLALGKYEYDDGDFVYAITINELETKESAEALDITDTGDPMTGVLELLAEHVPGWYEYDIYRIDRMQTITQYEMTLDNERHEAIARAIVSFYDDTAEIWAQLEPITAIDTLENIVKARGGYAEFVAMSDEVRELDSEVYECLLDRLRDFVRERGNLTSEDDIANFERGNWLVRYEFDSDGVSYSAGRDLQYLNIQTAWAADKWEDIRRYVDDDVIDFYIHSLKTQN